MPILKSVLFTKSDSMNPDDPVCLCFHVSRRKMLNFIRIEKPRRPSQLSECFGAGTGCGWCRPYLERLLLENLPNPSKDLPPGQSSDVPTTQPEAMAPQDYAKARAQYIRNGGGTPPPGATPIDEAEDDL